MKAPALLPPLAEPRKGQQPLAPVRLRVAPAEVMHEEEAERTDESLLTRPAEAQPSRREAVDTGYGDLVAEARSRAPTGPGTTSAPARAEGVDPVPRPGEEPPPGEAGQGVATVESPRDRADAQRGPAQERRVQSAATQEGPAPAVTGAAASQGAQADRTESTKIAAEGAKATAESAELAPVDEKESAENEVTGRVEEGAAPAEAEAPAPAERGSEPAIAAAGTGQSAPAGEPGPSEGTGTATPPAPQPKLSGDPGQLITSLANAPPSRALSTLAAVQAATPRALATERDKAQATLPEMPAPTGLPAKAQPAKSTPPQGPPVSGGADLIKARAGGGAPVAGAEKVPEAPALAPPASTELAGSDSAPPAAGGETPRDPALARSAQNAIAQARLPSHLIPASAGVTPQVDLSNEADPGQLSEAAGAAEAESAAARRQAAAGIAVDRGETSLFPSPDAEVLHPRLKGGPKGMAGGGPGGGTAPALPAEALASIDANAGPVLAEKLGAQAARYEEAQAGYQADAEQAHAGAQAEIQGLEDQGRADQQAARAEAQAEIAGARAEGQAELQGVHTKLQADTTRASADHARQIQARQAAGDREATQHLQKAEADAAAERRRAEAEAEQKKNEAKEESGGFLGWVKSQAKALVDGLKQAINFIYDGLRLAVKTIFETAKKLALVAIDLTRQAIVGLIKAYGVVLKTLVSIALAAFPTIRDKVLRRIDDAVKRATDLVDQIAEGLKKAVAAVLDFLAKTIDSLLGLIQDIYNGILTVVGMLISGELAELMKKLGQIVEAAKTAPGQFETAAYEELLGGNLDEPLSDDELVAAGRKPITALVGAGGNEAGEAEGAPTAGDEVELAQPPEWTEENVGVEQVASGVELSPELSAELQERAGQGGEVIFGESSDPDRSLNSILGLPPGAEQGQAPGLAQEGGAEQAAPQPAERVGPDGLTPRGRAEVKWTLMKKSLADWWSRNWPYIIGGGVLAVAGFIVANILTGGAITAALVPLMAALTPLLTSLGYVFTGMMVMQVVSNLRDFLQKGWAGDIPGGGKSLAKALAAVAVEVLSWLTFKIGSAAMRGAKAAASGIVRGAKAVGRVGARVARGALRVARRGVNYVLKAGKVLLRGVGDVIERGVKSLRELGARLLARTRFRGFRIKLAGIHWRLEGRINPWVLLATGEVQYKAGRQGTLGSKTTFKGADGVVHDAIVIGQKTDDQLANLFKSMASTNPSDAKGAFALLSRTDLRPDEILGALKKLSPGEAEEVLRQLRQLKNVDEAELRALIDAERARTGIPKYNPQGEVTGGTVAYGKAEFNHPDIDATYRGASPEAQTAPKTFGTRYTSPQVDPRAMNHAEQTVLSEIGNKIEAVAKAKNVPKGQMRGTVKLTVDQEVCAACRQGLDSTKVGGIFKQFSVEYPDVTLLITNTRTSEILIVKGGALLR